MASCPIFPNELILLLSKHQNSIPDVLSLSSTSSKLRSLFMANTSSILLAVCENDDLLSATKALTDTVFEVAALSSRTCDCVDDFWHCSENSMAGQDHAADIQAPFPAELRYVRALSRAVKSAMLVADKAATFWASKAHACAAHHETFAPDKTKFAQAYLFIWTCAQSHFSPDYEARAEKAIPESSVPAMALFFRVYNFMTFNMDGETRSQLGIVDPELDGAGMLEGVMLESDVGLNSNFWEWCTWAYFAGKAWFGKERVMGEEAWKAAVVEWQHDRPGGCNCPAPVLLNWDLVRIDWRHAWDRTRDLANAS